MSELLCASIRQAWVYFPFSCPWERPVEITAVGKNPVSLAAAIAAGGKKSVALVSVVGSPTTR